MKKFGRGNQTLGDWVYVLIWHEECLVCMPDNLLWTDGQVGLLNHLHACSVWSEINTGLFISPSGISDLCGTVTGMVTPKGNMSTEGERLQVSVLPYKCSICPPLVTRQMSILANSKTQNGFLFPVHAMFRHDCPPAIKPASTPRRLVYKKNLERFSTYLYASFCCVCLGCCTAEFRYSGGTFE
jgi:hypothetical protein